MKSVSCGNKFSLFPKRVAGPKWRLLGLAAIPILLASHAVAGSEPPARRGLHRWAIVPSKAFPHPEIADLVMLELGKIEGVALVEREQFARITDEQFLQLTAASGGGSRRDIGRILKADALLLLFADSVEQRTVLKVIVSECNFGARLLVETLPDPAETPEEAARVLAGMVATLRQRHADGIKWLAVLPPVVSRDLRHDFDHLQTSYTRVLENALSSIPGVAVIETEEAPSIRRELDAAGAELRGRVVPLEVEVSYQTSDAQDESTRVVFGIQMRDGQRAVREFDSPELDLLAAGGYLASTLRDDIARAAKIDSTSLLSDEQQFATLIERADLFSALGSYDQATGLREAALLLKPQAASQRKRLVTEYTARVGRCRSQMPGTASQFSLEEWLKKIGPNAARSPALKKQIETMTKLTQEWDRQTEAMVRQHSHWWGRAMVHLEYLVRNRQIDFEDGGRKILEYLQKIKWGHLGSWDHRPEVMQFLRSVMPTGEELPNEVQAANPDVVRSWRRDTWWSIPLRAAHQWAFDTSAGNDYDRYFEFYFEVLDQWVPEDREPDYNLVSKLRRQVSPEAKYREAYLELLRRLSQSKLPMNVVYGRFGLHVQEYAPNQVVTNEDLAELDELLKIYDGLTFNCRGRRNDEWLYSALMSRRRHYLRKLGPLTVKPSRRFPTAPSTPRTERPKLPAGRLRFEPLPLLGWGKVKGWISCGPGLDVSWDHDSIRWMEQAGQWNIPFHNDAWEIDDVQWDGSHVWITNRKEGVAVVAPSGKVVARITRNQGLPPADRGLVLTPLGEGRVIAVGGLGKLRRAWCAELTYDGDQTGVNVFLRAVHVQPPDQWDLERKKAHRLDTQSVFEPCWTHLYQPRGDDQTPWLLIGRKSLPPLPPLIVDPRTLAVSVYGDGHPYRNRFPGYTGVSKAFVSRDGMLLAAGTKQAMLLQWNTDGKFFEFINRAGPYPWGEPLGTVLPYRDWIYYAGSHYWSRFDPVTFEEERLTTGELPHGWEERRLAISSHYGLVTFGGSREGGYQVYRVVVPEDPPSVP